MNELPKLYYCNVWHCVHDTHGNKYPIKEHRNWKFVNFGKVKVGVSSLPIKMLINSFDDFMVYYIFYLHNKFPCIAMAYYVFIKQKGKRMSMKDFIRYEKQKL
jgi:hypothetical protein